MITIFAEKIKSFSQKNYNRIIDDLPFHKLSCTCEQKGCLIKHGYYNRSIKSPEGLLNFLSFECAAKVVKKLMLLFPVGLYLIQEFYIMIRFLLSILILIIYPLNLLCF